MANFLALKNYTIKDNTKWYNDRTNEANLADNYLKMEKVCVSSAMKNLKNINEIRVFRGEADNIREVFKENFSELYYLWKEGNNVLYADLDVVFTQPVNYFENSEMEDLF